MKYLKSKLLFIITLLITFSFVISEENENDINIYVTRELTNGLTEEDLKNPITANIIEELTLEGILEKFKRAYIAQGGSEEFDIPNFKIESKSWCLNVDNTNLIIIKINIEDLIQSTIIVGIKNDEFIRVAAYREDSIPIPHSYGLFAEKVEEIFDIEFKKK